MDVLVSGAEKSHRMEPRNWGRTARRERKGRTARDAGATGDEDQQGSDQIGLFGSVGIRVTRGTRVPGCLRHRYPTFLKQSYPALVSFARARNRFASTALKLKHALPCI